MDEKIKNHEAHSMKWYGIKCKGLIEIVQARDQTVLNFELRRSTYETRRFIKVAWQGEIIWTNQSAM